MVKIFTVFIKGGDWQCISVMVFMAFSVMVFMAFIKFSRESSQAKDLVSRVYLKWKLEFLPFCHALSQFLCFSVILSSGAVRITSP